MVHHLNIMGQNSSIPKRRHASHLKEKKNSLSHTFTFYESDNKLEQLNINIATEEELMTLEGVNREVAKNIVEHRKVIGRFRKIEDLALVKGIGADKLQQLRPEICISLRRNPSCASSRAQSYDSLKSTESRLTSKSIRLINVNKATVFQLQTINGINQETAAAIVHYRNKRGNFKKIEDLLKVRGIDHMRLSNISKYLTVDLSEDAIFEMDESRPYILTNGYTMPKHNSRSASLPLKLSITNGLPASSLNDIFEVLSAYSPRPAFKEYFQFCRNGESAVRVASWNLKELSTEKANNLGVKEVICRTILENGWSILAVQDVVNPTALKSICEELNKPRLHRVKEWHSKSHNWNFCMLDVLDNKLGFIYDSDGAIDVELLSLKEAPSELRNECDLLHATFMVGDMNLQLINMSLKYNMICDSLKDHIKNLISDEDYVMVFVDYSEISQTELFKESFVLHLAFSVDTSTNFISSNQKQNVNTSNILFNSKIRQQFTGYQGVVKQGLTHLAIPNGWSWGGPVSPFCPLWTELFVIFSGGTAL